MTAHFSKTKLPANQPTTHHAAMKLPIETIRKSVIANRVLATGIAGLLAAAAASAANLSYDAVDLTFNGTIGIDTITPANNTWTNTTPVNWEGAAVEVGWTDATGVDVAIFGGATGGTVTIPTGTTIVGNGITFLTDGYAIAGPGGFNFRGTTPTLTVGAGLTANFTAANNQNGQVAVTVTGGGFLNWGAASNGSAMTVLGGTVVTLTGGGTGVGQSLGGGTDTITSGVVTIGGTGTDLIFDTAIFTGSATGTFDYNGKSEVIGALGGSVAVTNVSSVGSSVLRLSTGTQTHTGAISDGTGIMSLRTVGSANQFAYNIALVQTLAGTNTYTGTTTHGKGTLTLDFSNASAPNSDILYNAVAKNSLILAGNTVGGDGSATRVSFTLTGKASTNNSQAFAGLTFGANSGSGIAINRFLLTFRGII